VRLRRALLAKLQSSHAKMTMSVLEPILILSVVSHLTILLPDILPCTEFQCTSAKDQIEDYLVSNVSSFCVFRQSCETYCYFGPTQSDMFF